MFSAFRRNSGFSLIELSLVLAIVGLFAAAGLETYRSYIRIKVKNDTEAHRNTIKNALAAHVTLYGFLPCPADPTLAPDQPRAGVSDCADFPTIAGYTGNVRRVNGGRKTAANVVQFTDWDTNTASITYGSPTPVTPVDKVLIGSVPYVTLGISLQDSLDGWNNRYTYAVSEYLTKMATFNRNYGSIRVLKLDNNLISPIKIDTNPCPQGLNPVCTAKPGRDDTKMSSSAMYVLVSHGRDAKGAYSNHGKRVIPCGTTPGRDNENCNDDYTFTMADPSTGIFSTKHEPPPLPPTLGARGIMVQTPAPGDTDVYFDDADLQYTLENSADKWVYQTTTSMYNKSKQDVGVGVTNPAYPLHVGGNIRANTAVSGEYCSPAWDDPGTVVNPDKPSYCFNPQMIAGLDGSVASGGGRAAGCPDRWMSGLAEGRATCATAASYLGIPAMECPTILGVKQYAIGIDSTGVVLCASPP